MITKENIEESFLFASSDQKGRNLNCVQFEYKKKFGSLIVCCNKTKYIMSCKGDSEDTDASSRNSKLYRYDSTFNQTNYSISLLQFSLCISILKDIFFNHIERFLIL